MYESYETLKIKEHAGIKSAVQELQYRKQHKELLPLTGLQDMAICFVHTEEINSRLESIDSLYSKVNCEQKLKEIILLDAFHSATIEGARTTVENVKKAFDKPKSKDDKMVVHTVHGMNYAYENQITMENIRSLWDIVTKDVCENEHLAGTKFRTGMVYVGSNTSIIHVPAKPEEIEPMINDLFVFANTTTLNEWLTACILHFYFVYIHAFCDGNGRTARILMQSYLYHKGKDRIKYLPLSRTINNSLAGYYSALKQSEYVLTNGKRWIDITPFLDYMLGVIEECMLTSIKEDNLLSDNQRQLLKKMQKRGKGTEITIATAADILSVSSQTAGKILNQLSEIGYLEKKKQGRRNIYILK